MPNFFAHYLHGQKVLETLPKDISEGITNIKLYEIGLQGPDIFYPYRALAFPNTYKINKIGRKIHKNTGRKFMEKLFEHTVLASSGDLFSYVCGFICHYSLDSVCHPYINEVARKNDFTHGEIEVEFDRVLLALDDKAPLLTKFSDMITVPSLKNKAIKEMAKAYKGYKKVTPKVLSRTLQDFKFFKKLFYSPSEIKQHVLLYVCRLFMLDKVYDACVMRTHTNPKSFITNTGLIFLFNDCIADSIDLIQNFVDKINSDTALSPKFNRRFV